MLWQIFAGQALVVLAARAVVSIYDVPGVHAKSGL